MKWIGAVCEDGSGAENGLEIVRQAVLNDSGQRIAPFCMYFINEKIYSEKKKDNIR